MSYRVCRNRTAMRAQRAITPLDAIAEYFLCCRSTYSRSTVSMRLCKPAPVDLNQATTSGLQHGDGDLRRTWPCLPLAAGAPASMAITAPYPRPPELWVEMLSPSISPGEIEDNIYLYLGYGAREA